MLTYQYTARNPATGQKVSSTVQADSDQAAAKLIRHEGLVPIDIKSENAGVAGFSKHFKKVRTKDRVLFSRQLSTLINAGLPLIQSLRSVNDQTASKPFRVVITSIIADVEGG